MHFDRQTPPAPRYDHAAAMHGERYLMIFGGCSHSVFFNDLHLLDLQTVSRCYFQTFFTCFDKVVYSIWGVQLFLYVTHTQQYFRRPPIHNVVFSVCHSYTKVFFFMIVRPPIAQVYTRKKKDCRIQGMRAVSCAVIA